MRILLFLRRKSFIGGITTTNFKFQTNDNIYTKTELKIKLFLLSLFPLLYRTLQYNKPYIFVKLTSTLVPAPG